MQNKKRIGIKQFPDYTGVVLLGEPKEIIYYTKFCGCSKIGNRKTFEVTWNITIE